MTKELEALKRIRQETCTATYMADFDKNECCDVIETALQRLEAIDNANPSEALECLEQFINEMTYCLEHPKEYAKGYERQIFWKYKNTLETTIKQALQRLEAIDNANPSEALKLLLKAKQVCDVSCIEMCNNCQKKSAYNTIKQALLKAQEPKHYLKWEDLEKFEEQKDFFALLNGNKYTLWRYRDSRNNYVMVNLNEINIATLCDMFKQDIDFFNDLHLERVEE